MYSTSTYIRIVVFSIYQFLPSYLLQYYGLHFKRSSDVGGLGSNSGAIQSQMHCDTRIRQNRIYSTLDHGHMHNAIYNR